MLAPIICLRHFAGMHDQRKSAPRQFSRCWRIEFHWQSLRCFAIDPSTCTERFIAANHHQSTTEIVNICVEHSIRFIIDFRPRHIDQHDGVISSEKWHAFSKSIGVHNIQSKTATLESADETSTFKPTFVDNKNASFSGDKNRSSPLLVLRYAICACSVRFEDGFISLRTAGIQTHWHFKCIGPRFKFNSKSIAFTL